MERIVSQLKEILDVSEERWKEKRLKYRLYYASPGSLAIDFRLACLNNNLTLNVETIFYPHLSTEALPFGEIGSLPSQLGLNIYKITPIKA